MSTTDIQFVLLELLADKSLGSRLVFFRNRAGLTQEELAQRCGVSQSTISRAESNPEVLTLSLLEVVRRQLGVSYDDLTDGASLSMVPAKSGRLRLRDLAKLRSRAESNHSKSP
jgi:transcriptional regulator with XRE-family HTH domain